MIKLKPDGGRPIPVAGIFDDGTTVCELYSGQTATVSGGMVRFPEYQNSIAILRQQK